jgi:hypothetical protein
MTVTFTEILQLPLFSKATILTGEKGLNREIRRINFMDMPLDADDGLTMSGDLFINSLFLVKDDPKMLEAWFDFYVRTNCAGVILINEYMQDLPAKIKQNLNKNNFPVILVDKDIPYAEIIMEVMELIYQEKTDTISKMQLDQLLSSNLSTEQVMELGKNVNPVFRKNYVSIFLTHSNQENENNGDTLNAIRNELCKNHKLQIVKYQSSLLVIVNFDDRLMYDSSRDFIKNVLGNHGPQFKMGVSNIYQKKHEFHLSIREALSAFEYCQEMNTTLVQYSDLDIYKLLLSVNNAELLKNYYHKYITPLQTKDQTDLLETLEVFIEFDGDYKKTSKYFNQHENTVRYRISKAKKLLNLEQNQLKFIEILSIGIKIKHIFEDLQEKSEHE